MHNLVLSKFKANTDDACSHPLRLACSYSLIANLRWLLPAAPVVLGGVGGVGGCVGGWGEG